MSRFNTVASNKTENLAGGEAYSQTPEMELISIMFTSFASDQFYRSGGETFARIKGLVKVCDKQFVARLAIYTRTQFGMRSISHVVASELAKYISGESWAKSFYDKIVYRPDDMMEILSYHSANNGKVPNSMKKGFAMAFGRFDKYSLAKYRSEGKSFKLIDVVNLVHPVPNDKNKEAIEYLVKGELKSFDTWETELSKTGQASTEDEKGELKKEVWVKLITERKLGYFALLRNLRNIIEQSPDVIDKALEVLTDEKLIKNSLVLPFRFTTAYEEIQKLNDGQIVRKVLMALNKSVDISLNNVPVFKGDSLVVLDVSGSMRGKPSQIGSLFSATLVKSNNCDFMTFDNAARYVNLNPMDSVITLSKSIPFTGGGTDFHSIFKTANKKYDRIIILSDMQGWIGGHTPKATFTQYKKATGADPFIYSFDLQGYGSMQFPERNVFCLTGFSDKIFSIMELLEKDKAALIKTIKEVSI